VRERHDLDGIGADGRIILKIVFKTYGKTWAGFVWLKSDTWLAVVKKEKYLRFPKRRDFRD
jgi:hypothetical protein